MKADRLQRVMRLGCAHALERSERYMDRVEEVLVEERNPKNAAQVGPWIFDIRRVCRVSRRCVYHCDTCMYRCRVVGQGGADDPKRHGLQ